jgi:Eco29kI restriction endonuclease
VARRETTKRMVYNPLDKLNLAKSIEAEILARDPLPLDAIGDVVGAGVYAIYYVGGFTAYEHIAIVNRDGSWAQPIYVGKAIPKGGRKGGLTKDASRGNALAERLRQHATSISEAMNLEISDFYVRYLVVDDVWIPLGENILIETFKPIWNRAIDGFGNKDPGQRRAKQYKSPWDILHPGRSFATKLADGPLTSEFLLQRISDYQHGRPLAKLPRAIAKQQAEAEAQAEDAADESEF